MICSLNNWLNKLYCFPVFYAMPAIDIVNGHGSSNEMNCEFQPNKANTVLVVHLTFQSGLRVIHHIKVGVLQ